MTKPIDPYVLPIFFIKNIKPKTIIVTKSIKYKSCSEIIFGIVKLPKNEDIPKTPRTLYIFEPNTFPRAKSTFLLIAASIPTANSGNEVPNATKEIPIIASGIFKLFAISIAELTNKSEP